MKNNKLVGNEFFYHTNKSFAELTVDEIFENLNFLKLKYVSKQFLALEDKKLEDFAEKYSSIIIYILNIIDFQLAKEFVRKLTINSLFHIIEEEARLILLSKLQFGDSYEILEKINLLLEEFEVGKENNFLAKGNFNRIKNAFEIPGLKEESFSHFIYLEIIEEESLSKILELILDNKPILIIILLIFSSEKVKKMILNFVINVKPELLQVIPIEVYDLKFYTLLRPRKDIIFPFLPDIIKEKFEFLEIVKRLEEGLDKIFEQFNQERISERERRELILNQIYHFLIVEPVEIQELLLIDLQNKKYLNSAESELMRLIFKNKGIQ